MLGLSRALFFAEEIAGTASYQGLQGFPGGRGCCVPWAHRARHGAGGRAGTPTLPSSSWGWIWGLPLLPHPFPKTCPFCRALLGAGMQTGWEGWSWAAAGWTRDKRARAAWGAGEGSFQLKS